MKVEAYNDCDWICSKDDHRSTIGFCTFVESNLVTWKSRKQTVVPRTSIEAKLRSMAHSACKQLWLKILIRELSFPIVGPMSL